MKRFWDKVKKTDGCWEWQASGRGRGYGCFKFKGKVYDSHRFIWFLTFGKWPSKWILHTCNNRGCVRPNHLYEGTPLQNYWDMRKNGNAHITPRKYANKEEKNKAYRKRKLEYWHRRGNYLREIRRSKLVNIPV